MGLNLELVDYIEEPTIFKFFKERQLKVIEVCMGESHILAIAKRKDGSKSESGDVYSWGLDVYGRLGYLAEIIKNDDEEIGENENYIFRRVPVALKIPDKISRIACGKDFSACLTNKGKLYTWGNNKWGNLGISISQLTPDEVINSSIINQPTLVKSIYNETLIQVVCGDKHMMGLTNERRVYSWGEGKDGALGLGTFDSHSSPQMIKGLSFEDIIFIAAGENTSAAINSKGQLYTWGSGRYGKLGLGTKDNIKSPMKVVDGGILHDRVFFISIGYYHSVCCTCKLIDLI